jgi:hypothetical protein
MGVTSSARICRSTNPDTLARVSTATAYQAWNAERRGARTGGGGADMRESWAGARPFARGHDLPAPPHPIA